MKNGARYVVTTHWGTFSLDEASYQDYLAGNLWICWTPGQTKQPKQAVSGYVPANVTDRAVALECLTNLTVSVIDREMTEQMVFKVVDGVQPDKVDADGMMEIFEINTET